jgi:hypothetical protein
MNVLKTLGDYVNEVFDKDKDGVVSFKEFMSLFPNAAIAIALLVVDVLVLVAEYRVWDFAMTLTGDPLKSIGFVLVSGFPFYLAQVLWLYPRATFIQQTIAVVMGAASLYTSAAYGFADLSGTYDRDGIFAFIVQLSAAYTVMLLVYVVTDKGVKAWRIKVKAKASADEAKEMNEITRSVLSDLRLSLQEEMQLKKDFDPEAVEAQLNRLRGQKRVNKEQPKQQMMVSYAAETELKDKDFTQGGER